VTGVARVDLAQAQQHGEVGDAEVRVPRRGAADLGAHAQIPLEQRRGLDLQVLPQAIDRQRQPGLDAVLDRRQMRALQLRPQAGCGVTAAVHRHAGAADQRVQSVPLHVRGDAAPQRQNDRAIAVVAVNARAADFEQPRLEVVQPGEVEFGFGVERAQTARLVRGQSAVGADQSSLGVAH